MKGGGFVLACLAGIVLDLVLFIAVLCVSFADPAYARPCEFAGKPHDRPVLETVQQVWEARSTGVAVFNFDGVHYVVDDLPKEYVDYSAWWVRLP